LEGTIKSAEEIAALFKTARKFHTDTIMALLKEHDNERGTEGRVAFIAGKRMGSAPLRNYAKRRMREAAQRSRAPWSGFDVIFVAKERLTAASMEGIEKDMERIRLETSATRRID